jgi:hypothetical protein
VSWLFLCSSLMVVLIKQVWFDIWMWVACGVQLHPWSGFFVVVFVPFLTLTLVALVVFSDWPCICLYQCFVVLFSVVLCFFPVVGWWFLWSRLDLMSEWEWLVVPNFTLDMGSLLLCLSRFSLWRRLHWLCFLVGLVFVWIGVLLFCFQWCYDRDNCWIQLLQRC